MTKKYKVVVLNDTRIEHHHGCSRVMNCIDYYLNRYAVDVGYITLNQDWQLSEVLKRQIVCADIVMVNGEGTIHHNSNAGLALVKVAGFAQQYGVKSYLINTTFQGNSASYRQHLLHFDKIYVRESYSQNALAELGIDSEVVADLTFSVVAEQQRKLATNKIVVTDSVKKTITDGLVKQLGEDEEVLFSSIFNNNITSEKSISVLQRIINVYKNNSLLQVLNKLFKLVTAKEQSTLWQSQASHIDYAHFLSQAELVICGRFHAMTICMNHGIAFLAIESNSHKISGTLTDIGLDLTRFLITPEKVNKAMLANFTLSTEERNLIEQYAEQAKLDIAAMFADMLASKC